MIPRVAHTVWVGPDAMPLTHSAWIAANRDRLASDGFGLLLWTGDDAMRLAASEPMAERFVRIAVANRKWAFLSDFIKTICLVRYGGWVLDADNEVIGSLLPFEEKRWVSGFEAWGGRVHPITAAMGAVPDHSFSHRLLAMYCQWDPVSLVTVPNTRWISDLLFAHGMPDVDAYTYLPSLDVTMYPSAVFCGPTPTDQTAIVHHFSGSWLRT